MMILRHFAIRLGAPKCPSTTFSSSSRTFSHQATRLYPAKPRRAFKPKAQAPPPKRSTAKETTPLDYRFMGRRPEGLEKLEQKVVQNGQVVIFEAPSQRSYVLGAYSISAFAFAYAVINSTISIGADNPTWQKGLFFGVCVAMSTMGTVFIGRTFRLIKKITAVKSNGHVNLEIKIRSNIPFRKPYTATIGPRQIHFARQLVVDPRRTTPDGKLKPTTMNVSFFKQPLKAMSYLFFRVFMSVRRLFTQEDFILVEMQGLKGTYRLDSNGYMSKDIYALGSPVKVQS